MGQLLVVVHHTDTSPSLCYEPELIPGPDGQYFTTANLWTWDQMLQLWELTHYSPGRDPYLDGPVGLQTERPACAGQHLVKKGIIMDKKTITGWSIAVTWSDGKEENILDIDDETARAVDTYLTEIEEQANGKLQA